MTPAIPAVAAAGFVGWAMIDRRPRVRSALTLAALGLALLFLLADQWNAEQVVDLRNRIPVVAIALALAIAASVGLAAIFLRHPVSFPIAVVLALPFRIPLVIGGEEANLLIPLYIVIGSGALAFIRRATTDEVTPETGPSAPRMAAWMRPLLAAFVVLYAVALAWSSDASLGLQNLCFFLIPFGALFVLLLEVEWSGRTLRMVFFVLVVQALVCAAVGFGQSLSRELFWNETVIQTNEFHVYFRVNSLFWDPNIYGRYLALVITVTAAVMAWSRDSRTTWTLAGIAFVLWLALVVTYSQSSFLALAAGLAVLLALAWNLRAVLVAGAALAAVGLALVLLAGGIIKLDLDRLNPQTGGRADLVTGGIELFGERPVLGWGAGSFSRSFRDEIAGPRAPVTESHTEPVTVAAETGVIGLALYLALLISTVAVLTSGFRRSMPGLGGSPDLSDPDRGPPVARAAVFAAYIALVVHTISYAGYLDDPATWALLAIGWGLAFRCRAT